MSLEKKMSFDIFLSICQTEVDGFIPSERQMFESFFDQVQLADELGFGTAWVAETHLSCQVQKENPQPVIPHFTGEIGLNTDILQMAHKIFAMTKNINVGSAIRNIVCNGGPIAHAEAVKTFLSLHGLNPAEKRKLELGFAYGRFPFSNYPYGVRPRNSVEEAAWPALRGKIFLEATEIFLRFLKGDVFSSQEVTPKKLLVKDFRTDEDWQKVQEAHRAEFGGKPESIEFAPFWEFDKVGVIPAEVGLENLNLTIGTHDPQAQVLANKYLPTGVFNLSITPSKMIEETHRRMKEIYHADGGEWSRRHMPRTVLIFIDDTDGLSEEEKNQKAQLAAKKAVDNYWLAIEGTLSEERTNGAVENALMGSPQQVLAQIKERFHPEDRLMLWFDFNNHDNKAVKNSMHVFMEKVAPKV